MSCTRHCQAVRGLRGQMPLQGARLQGVAGLIAVRFPSRQAHAKELPEGVDRTKYIASGLVAFDLRTRIVKWSTHLDLSTDSTTYRAYAYSAPTLVDIDRDGKLEVIAGTSVVSRCLCFA